MSAPQAWTGPALLKFAELAPAESSLYNFPESRPPLRLLVRGLRINEQHWLQVGISTRKKEELLGLTTRIFLLLFAPLLALSAAAGISSCSRASTACSNISCATPGRFCPRP